MIPDYFWIAVEWVLSQPCTTAWKVEKLSLLGSALEGADRGRG